MSWFALALVALLAMAGCGRKDDPMPPLIRVADTTRDLVVFQEGQQAVLAWSYPSITTAGGPLPDVEAVEVWRATLPAGQEPPEMPGRDRETRYQLLEAQGVQLALMDTAAMDSATLGSMLEYRDDLEQWIRRYGAEEQWVIWYAVRTVCCRKRPSQFSNIARLVPELPPLAPVLVSVVPTARGITVIWRSRRGTATMVERSTTGDDWSPATPEPVMGSAWQDLEAEQGRTWSYRLRAVRLQQDGGRVVGAPGETMTVAYPDVYPPPPPAELVCLPEATLVQVRWSVSGGAVSYVVSRQASGGRWEVLADRHTELQFEDAAPPVGKLTYAVRAVDAAGNVSDAATCFTVIGVPP